MMMRASVAAADASAPATEIDAGYERRGVMAGGSRLVVSVASHPEMMTSGGVMGMQTMRMASAEKMQLGDSVDVEAGGTVYAIRTAGTALTAQPFLNVTVHPGEVWAVRYRLATSRDVQDFDGLDSIAAQLPVAVECGARLCTESGTHQEIALGRRAGGGLLQAAVYHDAIARTSIAGTGAMGAAELAGSGGASGVVVDTETGSFRALGAGTTANGVGVTLSGPLTEGLWAALEFVSGEALETGNGQGPAGLHTGIGRGGDAGREGAGVAHRHQAARGLPLAAAAPGVRGGAVRGVQRPGVPQLHSAPGGALGRQTARRARSHHRRDQPAGRGLSAVFVGGWTHAVSGADSADGPGRAFVYVLGKA